MAITFFFDESSSSGGGVVSESAFLTVNKYDDLSTVSNPNNLTLAFVKFTQGNKYLPGSLGGTFRNSGFNRFSNNEWIFTSKSLSENIYELSKDKLGTTNNFEQYLNYVKASSIGKTLSYNADNKISKIVYTYKPNKTSSSNFTLSLDFNYNSDGKLIKQTISDSNYPSDLNKVKNIIYTGNKITSITYSK
jgi:hypothetical protein